MKQVILFSTKDSFPNAAKDQLQEGQPPVLNDSYRRRKSQPTDDLLFARHSVVFMALGRLLRHMITATLFLSFRGSGSDAQVIVKKAVFDPEGKAKITNLSEVQVDKDKKEIRLYFITKSTEKKLKAEILYFDFDFNFIKNENIEEEFDKIKTQYKLSFNLCPESKEPLLAVEPNMSGQVVFKKGYIQKFFNWETKFCDDRFKVEEKVKPKGDDGEKLKLIYYWSTNAIDNYFRRTSSVEYNYWKGTTTYMSYTINRARQVMKGDEGDVLFLGLLADGVKDPNLGKHYTIQRFSVARLEKVYDKPIYFDEVSVPIFKKYLSSGNISFVFHRIDNKIEYLEVNFNGDIQKRIVKDVPSKGIWIIDDIVETEKGDLLVSGVVSVKDFSAVARAFLYYPHNIARDIELWSWKPSGFQLMNVTQQINCFAFTPVKDFAAKWRPVDGEKKRGKPYTGGRIVVGDAFLTNTNNIVVTAQKKDKKGRLADIYCFYFDDQGQLISNYTTALRVSNEYNRYSSTRQALLNSTSTQDVYWTIFEVVGAKKRGETARILYSPRIARIYDGGQKVSSFLDIDLKNFFLDDTFPVNVIDEQNYFYLGSDKSGKELIFYKMYFE